MEDYNDYHMYYISIAIACMCVCVCVCVCTHICLCGCMLLCLYVCMCVCVFARIMCVDGWVPSTHTTYNYVVVHKHKLLCSYYGRCSELITGIIQRTGNVVLTSPNGIGNYMKNCLLSCQPMAPERYLHH